jgi:hypothetical protein
MVDPRTLTQKGWVAFFEIDYITKGVCEAVKRSVVERTERSWSEMYQNEIAHVGPNWE